MKSLDFKGDKGPFDIIGDVHGCWDELGELIIDKLGYEIIPVDIIGWVASSGNKLMRDYHLGHPQGRKLVFTGDLTDRGPASHKVLNNIMRSFGRGAYCVVGNHDDKLKRYLQGKNVRICDGLKKTIHQLGIYAGSADLNIFNKDKIIEFLDRLPSHLILDEGRLAVTHGALKEEYFGLDTPAVKKYCMYGAPNGRRGDSGEPLHHSWAQEYKGDTLIVHGHIVVPDVKWTNNTVNIDTGCVFGGKLTAFRYPEREIIQVQAKKDYHNA